MTTRTELGCIGHCIIGEYCHWRRHTQIGDKFRVSTIGVYVVDDEVRPISGLGKEYLFETMVFRTLKKFDDKDCGCHKVSTAALSGLERELYKTAGEAQAGHERLVEKYLALTTKH